MNDEFNQSNIVDNKDDIPLSFNSSLENESDFSPINTELSSIPSMPAIPTVPEIPHKVITTVDNDEVKMAQSQLYVAAKSALELHKMLKFVNELEGWCQAKITLASQNLEAVKNYIEYEMVSATLSESDISAGMVVEDPQDYKIYHNSPKVAAKLGWKNSPKSCHGSITSKYVIHDPRENKFIFTDNPKKHEVMEDFIKSITGRSGTTDINKIHGEWTKLMMDQGMNRMQAGEIADKMCAAKIAPKKMMESKEVWDEKNPDKKHHKLSPEKKAAAKRRAKEAGRPYPNMVDNMWAAKK
jgi:hypothetical protein